MEECGRHCTSAAHTPDQGPVSDMVRRSGAERELSTPFTVPAVLGTSVIGVPEGATAELDASLEVVTDGIWVSGSFRAEALGECSRCLDTVRIAVDVPLEGLFLYPGA